MLCCNNFSTLARNLYGGSGRSVAPLLYFWPLETVVLERWERLRARGEQGSGGRGVQSPTPCRKTSAAGLARVRCLRVAISNDRLVRMDAEQVGELPAERLPAS